MSIESKSPITALIGLGNPGYNYERTRHNIGFRVLDVVCRRFNSRWHIRNQREEAEIIMQGKKILLIKPQTFMNNSGLVMSSLQKQGIRPENILVVHDELELPFGTLKIRSGGSARGHNGLKSLIEHGGSEFARLRFGIGRPEHPEDVSRYVLQNFTEPESEISRLIEQAADLIEAYLRV